MNMRRDTGRPVQTTRHRAREAREGDERSGDGGSKKKKKKKKRSLNEMEKITTKSCRHRSKGYVHDIKRVC
jgi:hypothetical protein